MNRKITWAILIILGVLIAVYAGASWYYSNLIIAAPTMSLEQGRADTGDPADYGLPAPEEISIDTGEVVLSGWYFDNPLDGNCGVQFMHGFTGTRYHALYWAPLFWERGCDILAYDHRGHGESTPAFQTYGFHEKQDALAARNWFADYANLDPSQIGIGGVSYGAGTALQLAPLVPEAPFILADSAYRSLPAIVGVRAEVLLGDFLSDWLSPGALLVAGLRADFNAQDVSPERAIADARVPVLLIHSRTDDFTPASHSEAIFANSDQSRTVLNINDWGSTHAADISTDFAAYRAEVDEFLKQFAPDFGLPIAP